MSIRDKINRAVEGWRTKPAVDEQKAADERAARVFEAVGRSIEAEDAAASISDLLKEDSGWRRIGAIQDKIDLNPMQRTVLTKIAVYFNTGSPLAVHMLDTFVSYVIGGCVQFKAHNERLDTALKTFWDDPDNRLSEEVVKFGREFFGLGELFLPIFVGQQSGLIKLGYIHPLSIKEVKTDPDNARKFTEAVEFQKNGEDRIWTIVNADTKPSDILNSDGNYLLYFPLQRFAVGRGRPMLEAAYYWIDHIQNFLADRILINKFMKAWAWVLTVDGGPDKVTAKQSEVAKNGIKPGSVYVKNLGETLEALSPDVNASDVKDDLVALLKYVGHAANMPGHWVGAEDDVNRNTASSTDTPAVKFQELMQKTFMEGVVLRILQLQRDLFIEAGYISTIETTDADGKAITFDPSNPEDMEIDVEQPDLTPTDNVKTADALQKVVPALSLAVDGKFTDLATAQSLFHSIAGVEQPDNLDQLISEDISNDILGVYADAQAKAQTNAQAQQNQNGNQPALEVFNPNQPRVPSGSDKGGEWTSGDGGGLSVNGEKFIHNEFTSAKQELWLDKHYDTLKEQLVNAFPDTMIHLDNSKLSEACYITVESRNPGEYEPFIISIRNHDNTESVFDHAIFLSDEKYNNWNDVKKDVFDYVSKQTGLKPQKGKAPDVFAGIKEGDHVEALTTFGEKLQGEVTRVVIHRGKVDSLFYKNTLVSDSRPEGSTFRIARDWTAQLKRLTRP